MSIGAIQPPATRPAPAAGRASAAPAPVERVIEGEVLGDRGHRAPPFGAHARPSFAPGDPRHAIAAYLEQAHPPTLRGGVRVDCYA